jgi:hypothetical protein
MYPWSGPANGSAEQAKEVRIFQCEEKGWTWKE